MRCCEFTGNRALVTGANGYIGPHLCRKLCADGYQVFATSRVGTPSVDHPLTWLECDLTCVENVKKIFASARPDVVFHLAGLADGGRQLDRVLPTFESNLTTTVNLLTAATEIGCARVIYSGSFEEPDCNISDMVPSSPYAAAKWAGSNYARMFHQLYNTQVVILRLFMTYGPGKQNQQKLIPYVIRSLLQGQAPKLSSGTRQIDWIFIDDVVDAMIKAALASNIVGSTIDIGSGRLVSIREIVKRIVKIVDKDRILPLFGEVGDRPMEQVKVADLMTTREKIGWEPKVDLDKGLKITVDWYKQSS
jgi:nucleoside-diphosphate-sugar epimerase